MIETRDLSCTFSEGSFSQNRFTAVSPISAVFKMEDVMRLSVNPALGKQHLHG